MSNLQLKAANIAALATLFTAIDKVAAVNNVWSFGALVVTLAFWLYVTRKKE